MAVVTSLLLNLQSRVILLSLIVTTPKSELHARSTEIIGWRVTDAPGGNHSQAMIGYETEIRIILNSNLNLGRTKFRSILILVPGTRRIPASTREVRVQLCSLYRGHTPSTPGWIYHNSKHRSIPEGGTGYGQVLDQHEVSRATKCRSS